jgi:methyl-accepting chemotaxis protein
VYKELITLHENYNTVDEINNNLSINIMMRRRFEMKNKRSLKMQIITLLVIAIALPLIIVTIYSNNTSKNNFDVMYNATTKDNLDRTSEVINNLYKSNEESINMLSEDPNAKSVLNNAACEPWLVKSLEGFLVAHKNITSVYLGVSNGKMLLAPATELPAGYDPRTRPWYKQAMENNGQVILSEPYEDASNPGCFIVTFAKTVKDIKTGAIVGVVGLDIKLDTLSALASKIKIGENGYVAILDSTGKIIAHNDPKVVGKTAKEEPWITEVLASQNNLINKNIGGKDYRIIAQKNDNSKWIIVGFASQNEILNKINSSRNMTILISIIALISASLFGTMLVGKIVKSINKLIFVLNKAKDGDFSERIEKDEKASSEINSIAEAVNDMIEGMVLVITNVLSSTKKVRESTEGLAAITQESTAIGEEVSKAMQQIADGATEQAIALDESASITNNLGDDVNKSIKDADDMISASNEVKNSTEEGIIVVSNLKEIFGKTSIANTNLAKEVEILADNSNKISAITDTIKAITEQTNLLALNASIEAARAGEAGRGFAVVADEVRKLAEQSSESASEINKVITEIKQSVSSVYEKINEASRLNEKTKESVEVTNGSFVKIESATEVLEQSMKKVMESLSSINSNKDLVVTKISEAAFVAQQTAASTEEVNASSEQQTSGLQEVVASAESLSSLAQGLDELVNKFKI